MDALPLKDIHLPNSIGWWPPAPGWWLLPVILALLVLALRHVYCRLSRRTAIKRARSLLKTLRQKPVERLQILTELSALLRRAAISSDSRGAVAALRGQAWLEYLDKDLPDAPFSQGVGRCLADAHFRPTAPDDVELDDLFELCERWLKRRGKRS